MGMKTFLRAPIAAITAGLVFAGGIVSALAASGGVPFIPLHTYYISPNGSDSNNGTSPISAWATPQHNVVCGDVIIAAADSYTNSQFGSNSWGTVSNCPSTTGGIDGAGGIHEAVLLCAGPFITSCNVNGGDWEAFRIDSSNWAVEGFSATQGPTSIFGCFLGAPTGSSILHHIVFINNIASSCAVEGFGTVNGVDQSAVVGAITYNAAPSQNNSGICGSGISMIPSNGPVGSLAISHVFVAGTFNYKNINAPTGAGCNTDGEGLIFDTWGGGAYKYEGVVEQNVWWANGSSAFAAFPQGNGTTDDAAIVVVFNNTSYGNYQDPHNPGAGELFLNQIYPEATNQYTITNNIFEATLSKAQGAAIDCFGNYSCPATVIKISGNYIWNSFVPTTITPGGRNTQAWYNGNDQGASFPWGTNTYNNPGFANPGGLPIAAPNCSGYTNTTDCMNTGYHVAANLKPSGGAVGKGYMAPGPCAPDPYYPKMLKGLVYLTVSGTTITENPGLITKPCGS